MYKGVAKMFVREYQPDRCCELVHALLIQVAGHTGSTCVEERTAINVIVKKDLKPTFACLPTEKS